MYHCFTQYLKSGKSLRLLTVLCLGLGLFQGCQSFKTGTPQEVYILSYPVGAEVLIAGELVGHTPLRIDLGRKVPHEVRLNAPGYKTYIQDITPVLTDSGRSKVKLGLIEELGSNNDLSPNPVIAVLQALSGPRTPAYDAMSAIALGNTQWQSEGQISDTKLHELNQEVLRYFSRP